MTTGRDRADICQLTDRTDEFIRRFFRVNDWVLLILGFWEQVLSPLLVILQNHVVQNFIDIGLW